VRILYVLPTLGVGGAEKQVISVAERMSARGHTVAFLIPRHAADECSVKQPVLRLNMSTTPLGIFRGLRFAAKFVALFGPDIVHSHSYPANIFSRLLRVALRFNKHDATPKSRAPVFINTIHNVYEGGWHRMLAYGLTSGLVDWTTTVSTAALERFVRLRAVSADRASVLTNGIDTDAFKADRQRRKRTRSELQARDNFIWLAVGRLVPAKDYPNLLRAFDHVLVNHPHTELWIVGGGDNAAILSEYSHSREPTGAKTGLDANKVRFLGLRHDVAALLDAADGFVLSSAWEGMPLAVGEAMALEKPVVATDVGGVRELVGDTGTIVHAQDSEALGQAMVETMRAIARTPMAIRNPARERIKALFSIDAKANEWEARYVLMMKEKSL
jgi:glycosyltransferase involved in cell wall biosynthesis